MQKEKKQPFHQEIETSKIDEDYQKWLYEFVYPSTLIGLNKMGQICTSSMSINNTNYQPIQGA